MMSEGIAKIKKVPLREIWKKEDKDFTQWMEENIDYRAIGNLPNTDKIMNDSFWIGLYPGMGDDAIDYMIKKIKEFLKRY